MQIFQLVAIGVNAHLLLVGNADEIKRPILKERALDTTGTGVYADSQENKKTK